MVSQELGIPKNKRRRVVAAITKGTRCGWFGSKIAETSSNAYAISGSTANQSQSSNTGRYTVCCRARLRTITAYATPATPQVLRARPTLDSPGQGALRIAEMSSTAQKCTMFGVPKAAID